MKIIYKDGHVDECPQDQELHVIRHTAAHIMHRPSSACTPRLTLPLAPPPRTASTTMSIWRHQAHR